jgi:hypothetical protein
MTASPSILYCHCNYARVVPPEVKQQVLEQLTLSGATFEAVPDLCEMSARRDPKLAELASGPLKIVACYPRAVRWLFASAGVPLAEESFEILNMRTESADAIVESILPAPPAGDAR